MIPTRMLNGMEVAMIIVGRIDSFIPMKILGRGLSRNKNTTKTAKKNPHVASCARVFNCD